MQILNSDLPDIWDDAHSFIDNHQTLFNLPTLFPYEHKNGIVDDKNFSDEYSIDKSDMVSQNNWGNEQLDPFGRQIVCNVNIIVTLTSMKISAFVRVYGKFFSALHEIARTQKKVVDPIVYDRFPTPWLRKDVQLFIVCKSLRSISYIKKLCRPVSTSTKIVDLPFCSAFSLDGLRMSKVHSNSSDITFLRKARSSQTPIVYR